MTRALLYHDVVPAGDYASSGFQSPDANIYKFTIAEFEQHLTRIRERAPQNMLLTFDDGGVSAIRATADIIERFGHKGHFFITTDYIGTTGFMSVAEISELARRGHIIGSHSCSHPALMSRCQAQQLDHEWRDSVARLSDILGAQVATASVPGGSYSNAVGRSAAAAKITTLFTSEPTSSVGAIDTCTLIGRFSVQRGTTPEIAAALAAGDLMPALRQAAYWNFKKILKRAGGTAWIEFRKAVLAKRSTHV
jgi:peptidoglycan/xylan/chitin deacetylase (PgdA/CDA1 family)